MPFFSICLKYRRRRLDQLAIDVVILLTLFVSDSDLTFLGIVLYTKVR